MKFYSDTELISSIESSLMKLSRLNPRRFYHWVDILFDANQISIKQEWSLSNLQLIVAELNEPNA